MQVISESEPVQILLSHSQGLSEVKIAREMIFLRNAVLTTISRYQETNYNKKRFGQGRKRLITTHEDRLFQRITFVDRIQTSSDISGTFQDATGKSISRNSVGRRHAVKGIMERKLRNKSYLSEVNQKIRLK